MSTHSLYIIQMKKLIKDQIEKIVWTMETSKTNYSSASKVDIQFIKPFLVEMVWLMLCTILGSKDIAEVLVASGADINLEGAIYRSTCLHVAAQIGKA